MSNIKHPKCPMREAALKAKARLAKGEYGEQPTPPNISPRQRDIYLKLSELKKRGEEVINPIAQLADEELMRAMPHDERQRYIIQLASDYVSVRNLLDGEDKKNMRA